METINENNKVNWQGYKVWNNKEMVCFAAACSFSLSQVWRCHELVAFVCAIYVVSAYYTRWYFLGNYTMWVRSSYVTDKGVYPVGGIVISIALFTVSLIAGYMYIDNKDVI